MLWLGLGLGHNSGYAAVAGADLARETSTSSEFG